MYINKRTFILINIILIILEITIFYFIINSFLTKDLISPNNDCFYKYLKTKMSTVIK